MDFSRRSVLAGATSLGLATSAPLRALPAPHSGAVGAADEKFWAKVAAQYGVTEDIIQLENGNWGIMARPVLETYQRHVERVNRDNSYYARRGMGADLDAARARLARFLKVGSDEVVFTRNATEALKALIGGYNRLRPGDAVLYADLDYGSMQASLAAVADACGAGLITMVVPEPADRKNVIAAYENAFDKNPNLKLVLLTHISHRTGLMIPVREIADKARSRGIDVIVDAAHSLGQVEYAIPDLGADFVGLNLHKWIGAPLGVGAMYIKRNRINAIDPDIADEQKDSGLIDSRVHTGTVDYAALLTVPAALDFQATIGASSRAARLRFLRDQWVDRLRSDDRFEILTPDDPAMHGGITSFRLRGVTSEDGNRQLARRLLEDHSIFTVHRTGVAAGSCVRITPALFNSPVQFDSLVIALKSIADNWKPRES